MNTFRCSGARECAQTGDVFKIVPFEQDCRIIEEPKTARDRFGRAGAGTANVEPVLAVDICNYASGVVNGGCDAPIVRTTVAVSATTPNVIRSPFSNWTLW